MNEFQEKFKVVIDTFSTGSTVEKFTRYYDMKGFRRADFFVTGLVKLPSTGALGATDYQNFTIRALQASNSTGGGASAMATATAVVGKDSATGISTSVKCREGFVFLSTLTSAVPLQITVNGVVFTGATATAAANQFACASAAAAATVTCQAFAAMFNSTADNTSTVITANWEAATEAAGVPCVRIIPKDPDGTHLLTLGTTGSSQVGVGGVFTAHIGIDQQFMADGKRYLAIGVKSTEHANPYTVTVIREPEDTPAKAMFVSVSINRSTSK
jgi:hypothetical protein